MKKFPAIANDKKSQLSATNKISRTRRNNTLQAVAKKKADKLINIFNYQYQESDLEQFVF